MNKGRECGYAPIDRHNPVRPTLATHWLLFFLLQCDDVTMYRRQRPDPTRPNPTQPPSPAPPCAQGAPCAGGVLCAGGCCAPRKGNARRVLCAKAGQCVGGAVCQGQGGAHFLTIVVVLKSKSKVHCCLITYTHGRVTRCSGVLAANLCTLLLCPRLVTIIGPADIAQIATRHVRVLEF